MKLQELSIWHYRVVEVVWEGPGTSSHILLYSLHFHQIFVTVTLIVTTALIITIHYCTIVLSLVYVGYSVHIYKLIVKRACMHILHIYKLIVKRACRPVL